MGAISPHMRYTKDAEEDQDKISDADEPFFKATTSTTTSEKDGLGKDKDDAVVFKMYYRPHQRQTLSFLLPNNWLVCFTFHPKSEAQAAATELPRVGGLARSAEDYDSMHQKSSSGLAKKQKKQATLVVTHDTGPLNLCAKAQCDYSDPDTVIGGYWLPNGVFVRRVEVRSKEGGTLPPEYVDGEVRVIGCPLDEKGLAKVRFIVRRKVKEPLLRMLWRKMLMKRKVVGGERNVDYVKPPVE